MIYFARRSGVFMSLMYFIGTFYLYLNQSNGNKKIYKFLFLLSTITVVTITIYMYSDSTFSLLFNRLYEDTRSGVDEAIIKYINSEKAWIFGKGIEGAYYQSAFDAPRYTHETGYLYLILKGGIIYLFLYVILLLHSAYIGFFKTENRLTKALALYVFLHVIFLLPFGLPSFGLEYLFVWVSFAFCESAKWRSMTNQQIKFYLQKIQ